MTEPNRMRMPRNKSVQFQQGWRACEAGRALDSNPYTAPGGYFREWAADFNARADRGFDVSHLPRKPFSDAFA